MSHGWRHGKGRYMYANGGVYEGQFVSDCRIGVDLYRKLSTQTKAQNEGALDFESSTNSHT
eukprot:1195150-Prorocentrum_minimum.AAC.4